VISVIIPAYNEAGPLPATVAALRGLPEVDEIVVVDDGSTDETAAVAEGLGCRVVRLVRNRGKGKALTAGVRAAKGDVLVFLDADLGASAAEARRLLAPLLAGEADMVIGRFPEAQRPGGLGMVKALARAGVRWLGGLAVAAPLSGQRAIRRTVLEAVGDLAGGFGVEVGLTDRRGPGGFPGDGGAGGHAPPGDRAGCGGVLAPGPAAGARCRGAGPAGGPADSAAGGQPHTAALKEPVGQELPGERMAGWPCSGPLWPPVRRG